MKARSRAKAPAARNNITGLLLAGVGGQGVLLVSELLALAAIEAGYDAKQTEIHGVSQRGGSVHSHVRFGPRVYSPLIPKGKAAFVVALEKLEALRFAAFAAPGGTVVVNDHEVLPLSAGEDALASYPHDAGARLEQAGYRVVAIPATAMAADLGQEKVANVLVLGYLAAQLPIDPSAWDKALVRRVPEKYLDLNRQAFEIGFGWAGGAKPGAPGPGRGPKPSENKESSK